MFLVAFNRKSDIVIRTRWVSDFLFPFSIKLGDYICYSYSEIVFISPCLLLNELVLFDRQNVILSEGSAGKLSPLGIILIELLSDSVVTINPNFSNLIKDLLKALHWGSLHPYLQVGCISIGSPFVFAYIVQMPLKARRVSKFEIILPRQFKQYCIVM